MESQGRVSVVYMHYTGKQEPAVWNHRVTARRQPNHLQIFSKLGSNLRGQCCVAISFESEL